MTKSAFRKSVISVIMMMFVIASAAILLPKKADAGFDSGYTVSPLYIGQKTSIGLPAWHIHEVLFLPSKVGGWNLVASTNNIFQNSSESSIIIEYYWRNGPTDSWHFWRRSTFSIYNWTEQWIYSGSSSIEFKFRLYHFMDSPTGVNLFIK